MRFIMLVLLLCACETQTPVERQVYLRKSMLDLECMKHPSKNACFCFYARRTAGGSAAATPTLIISAPMEMCE